MNYYILPGMPVKRKQHPISQLIKLTCEYFCVRHQDLISKSRKREFVEARYFLYWYGYKQQLYTYKALGIATNNRDHTTVLHGVKVIDNLCFSDNKYLLILSDYQKFIKNRL